MTITFNLARPRSFCDRYLMVWAVPALGLGLLLLVQFLASARADYRQAQRVRATLERERARAGQLRGRELALRRELDQPRYRDVLKQVRGVNSLIDEKRLSLTEVTVEIARLLPPQARLSSLSVAAAAGGPLVRVGVEAQAAAQAETFVANLEQSPDFKDVTVTQQSFVLKPGEPVTVNCTAHYAGPGEP